MNYFVFTSYILQKGRTYVITIQTVTDFSSPSVSLSFLKCHIYKCNSRNTATPAVLPLKVECCLLNVYLLYPRASWSPQRVFISGHFSHPDTSLVTWGAFGRLMMSSLWHNRPEMNCASEKYGKMLKQSSRALGPQMGQLIEICCMRPTYKLSGSIRNMKSQLYLQMFWHWTAVISRNRRQKQNLT